MVKEKVKKKIQLSRCINWLKPIKLKGYAEEAKDRDIQKMI